MYLLIDPLKFKDPLITAKGEIRASVNFKTQMTLWLLIEISEMALERGHSLLILTNAMKPLSEVP